MTDRGLRNLEVLMTIFFTSAQHRVGFLTAMRALGKIYDGQLDPQYGAALYILTADSDTWNQASDYVDRGGIRFEDLLAEIDFSGAYVNLIRLAGNLFNGNTACSPVELYRLDDRNFQVALSALQIRRASLRHAVVLTLVERYIREGH